MFVCVYVRVCVCVCVFVYVCMCVCVPRVVQVGISNAFGEDCPVCLSKGITRTRLV